MIHRFLRRSAILLIAASLFSLVTFFSKPQSANAATISSSTWYTVVNQGNGKCVDDAAGGTANGTVIQQWACVAGSTNQQWQFIPTSGGNYEVVSKNAAAMVWDIAGPSTANGALLHLWTYGGGANQQWLPVALDATHYKFVNLYSGTCLDVPAASTTDGTQLEQYTCNGTTAQSWSLNAVGGAPTNTPTNIPPTNTPIPTTVTSADGTPFSGTAYALPGKVEAENYNNGGQNVAYSKPAAGTSTTNYRSDSAAQIEATTDTGGGFNVGWTATNDWYKYTVNATSSSSYTFDVRVASANTGSALHLEVDGTNVTGSLTVPNSGGWQTWTDVTKSGINLSAGQHVVRLFIDAGGMNINWFSASAGAGATVTPTFVPATNTPVATATNSTSGTPFSGTPYSIPGKVEAENYNNGGEGVAYHDSDATNSGTQYRTDGVDIEATTDTGGGFNVGWTATGEWTNYTVNVTSSGTYSFDVRVASGVTGGALHLEVDGANVTGSLTVPNTGGWQTWTDVTKSGVSLSAGQHVVRLVIDATGMNINWFNIVNGNFTATPIPSGPPDFGPNVIIYDTSMSSTTIQNSLNNVFNIQQSNQFGSQRYALLFKPGTYPVDANIGFYTQISGLGLSPTAVTLNHVTSDAQWLGGNDTCNFWRDAENMTVAPPDGTDIWATAQAGPFRRMNVRGNLNIHPSPPGNGWASGGWISDSVVTGTIFSGGQQQFITRNSEIGGWSGSNWNMVFVGVNGAPAQTFPNPPMTTIGQSPIISEKPFLYIDSSGNYNVFVPALQSNTGGTTWNNKTAPGSSLPISQFFIVKPGATAADMNNALASGLNLLITPGIYNINQTINVTRANTVVLGMGLATLVSNNGVVPMQVSDVDGVKVAGLLFDAGNTNSPSLLQVGPSGASASHAGNPTVLSDVFIRVGGTSAQPNGRVTNSVIVNNNDTIIDHTWIWRADHGDVGTGWTTNPGTTGIIINGANVTAYGLFVEHFEQYNVIWNNNGGRTYMFQNELPYDVPDQASYMNGSTRGWAAYKVANNVTTHQAWGLGVYCNFSTNNSVVNDRGFEVPATGGVVFHDLLTVSLGNTGTIAHVINNTGAQTSTTTSASNVVSFP